MNVLVLSGGGSLGAWQAGAIDSLYRRGHRWDAVVGTSVGAINGAGVSLLGVQGTLDLWRQLQGTGDVQRLNWYKLPWATGLYNFGPLKKLLQKYLTYSEPRGIPAYASYLSLKNGTMQHKSQWDVASSAEYIDAILGSSSLGFVHEPINGDWVDAGHQEQFPIDWALKRFQACSIDAVGTSPVKKWYDQKPIEWPKFVFAGIRSVELQSRETYWNDVRPFLNNTKVKIYAPKSPLPYDSMDYSAENIATMIKEGRDAADAMDSSLGRR